MRKCERVYVPHPNFRFPTEPLYKIANEIVYVCDAPMFDDMMGPEHRAKFEGQIANKMDDFDCDHDCIAFYGDPIIFALMVALATETFGEVKIARFSQKLDEYVVRKLDVSDNWTTYE